MIPAHIAKLACAALLATGLSAASTAFAQPEGVSPLNVTSAYPTSVTLSIKGKDAHTVRTEVAAAARFVCRNFVGVKGISLDDVDWCADRSSAKAMKRYAALVSAHALAESGSIVLSAR
jgi:hypothetical protein